MRRNSLRLGLGLCCLFLIGGCAGQDLTSSAALTPTAFVCPPRPTRTPDPRPTETPFVFTSPPTNAPTRTPGPPSAPRFTPAPTLHTPLDTEERVLGFLYAQELRNGREWQDPWCVEMLQFDRSRVEAIRFNSVYEAESTMGASTGSREAEPAWVVTVRGTIDLVPPGGPVTAKYMRQVIGETTGSFYVASFGRQDPPPTLGAPKTPLPTTIRTRRAPRPTASPTP